MNKTTKTVEKDQATPEEEIMITSLRAASWQEFHGQENVKQAISIAITAAKKTERSHRTHSVIRTSGTREDDAFSYYRSGNGK